jgi:hypothetical protein
MPLKFIRSLQGLTVKVELQLGNSLPLLLVGAAMHMPLSSTILCTYILH